MTPLLPVSDIVTHYVARIGRAAVSFDLYSGEVMGIVEESGSGKSPLFNGLARHLEPAARCCLTPTRMGWSTHAGCRNLCVGC